MKIYVLMPTYNDGDSIVETLDSIISQKYKNWELIIINDGSTDNTENIVKKYIKEKKMSEKIIYLYQENKDQLNAIKNGAKQIKDKKSLVYILHSDDLLVDNSVFERVNNYFQNHEYDAITADLKLINEKSELIGNQIIKNYKKEISTCALQELWLGRQLFIDFAFWKYSVFITSVYQNYLNWNMPYWLTVYPNLDMMNVKKVDFPFIKYRVYPGNYINSEIGVLNVLNGELRTLIGLMNYINVPFYIFQYYVFRILNKLKINYIPIYSKTSNKRKYKTIKFTIKKRIKNITKYPYYTSILNFYRNYNNNRTIKMFNISTNDVFLGSDMRSFNKLMITNKLPKLYYDLFEKISKGFRTVLTDEASHKNVVNILKFFSIYHDVIIIRK